METESGESLPGENHECLLVHCVVISQMRFHDFKLWIDDVINRFTVVKNNFHCLSFNLFKGESSRRVRQVDGGLWKSSSNGMLIPMQEMHVITLQGTPLMFLWGLFPVFCWSCSKSLFCRPPLNWRWPELRSLVFMLRGSVMRKPWRKRSCVACVLWIWRPWACSGKEKRGEEDPHQLPLAAMAAHSQVRPSTAIDLDLTPRLQAVFLVLYPEL